MKIQIDNHTFERAAERGVTIDEIEDVINNGISIKAKKDRFGKTKIYLFSKERNGKYYENKRVDVFYIIEDEVIITVTVYAFYGKWEKQDEYSI